MIKFHYKNQIHNFFHIPKTAGTSISFLIQDNFKHELIWEIYEKDYNLGSQHLSYSFFKKHVSPGDINFAVVRSPVDRIVSLYKNFAAKGYEYKSFLDWFWHIKKHSPHILKSQYNLLKGGKYIFYNFDSLYLLENYLELKLPRYNVIELPLKIEKKEIKFIKRYYQEDFQLLEYISSSPQDCALKI